MKPHPKNVGDHLYVAVLLPFDRQMKIDEPAYRRFLQYFLKNEKFVRMGGGLCINPEAGEIFYLTRQEKRRVLEIAMEEVNGKVPILAGTWAITTDETVETARDCKALGVDGIFVTPPGGAQDVTSCWDADNYPEIWLDQIIAQDRAVDLADRHASGRGRQAAVLSGLAARSDAAHLPRGAERGRLEDDVHVRRLPHHCEWPARAQSPCRRHGCARLALS